MAAALEQALGRDVLRGEAGRRAGSTCRPTPSSPTRAHSRCTRRGRRASTSRPKPQRRACAKCCGWSRAGAARSVLLPALRRRLGAAAGADRRVRRSPTRSTLTRELSARGATIHELNAVRRELSARQRRRAGAGVPRRAAGRRSSCPMCRATIWRRSRRGRRCWRAPAPDEAIGVLREVATCTTRPRGGGRSSCCDAARRAPRRRTPTCRVTNLVIGNNADGRRRRRRRGGAARLQPRDDLGRRAGGPGRGGGARSSSAMAARMRDAAGPDCLISGGEPTVQLAPDDERGRGGRNQQLCLAALAELRRLARPGAPLRRHRRRGRPDRRGGRVGRRARRREARAARARCRATTSRATTRTASSSAAGGLLKTGADAHQRCAICA